MVKLEHYHFPWQLEAAIGDFVDYYNYDRPHGSLRQMLPAQDRDEPETRISGGSDVVDPS